MGCVGSTPARTEYRKKNPPSTLAQNRSGISDLGYRIPNEMEFEEMMKNVYSIVHIDGSSPIVCIGDNTFPIAVEELYSEENEPINFDIPIVAAAKHNLGRVVCFGNSLFLAPKVLQIDNTEELFQNCLRWVSATKTSPQAKGKALLLGFQQKENEYISTFLRRRKVQITTSDTYLDNVTDFQYVFLSLGFYFSAEEQEDSLLEYVSNGGSLLVFAAYDKELINFELNSFLIEIGLAYPRTNFVVGCDVPRIFLSHTFADVNLARFSFVRDNYISILKMNEIDIMDFDTSISVLHLYTSSLGKQHYHLVEPLYRETLNYLKRTDYITEDGIAPLQLQTLAIVQLTSLLIKSPLVIPNGCPTIEDFPGIADPSETTGTFTRNFVLNDGQYGWISTGLWLQASESAKITMNKFVPMKVQVGSHIVELTRREGPYKRWPLIVNEIAFKFESVVVDSPFGGLVYLVTDEIEEDDSIEVTFEGFIECPRYVKGKPEIWEQTKDRNVPWGEMESDFLVFTLPRNIMLQITDFEKLFNIFEIATTVAAEFMCVDIVSPVRVVYDCEILSGSIYPKNYNPIYLHLTKATDLFDCEKPSTRLFQLFTKIGMSLISSDNLDKLTKKTLSVIASADAFLKIWPNEDPFQYMNKCSKLTQSLWEIHTNVSNEIIPQTIDQLRGVLPDEGGSPDDPWIAFVMLLSKNGGRNFTATLQKSRPIPLNATLSVRQLPAFM
jgi:hypothetical protein